MVPGGLFHVRAGSKAALLHPPIRGAPSHPPPAPALRCHTPDPALSLDGAPWQAPPFPALSFLPSSRTPSRARGIPRPGANGTGEAGRPPL